MTISEIKHHLEEMQKSIEYFPHYGPSVLSWYVKDVGELLGLVERMREALLHVDALDSSYSDEAYEAILKELEQ